MGGKNTKNGEIPIITEPLNPSELELIRKSWDEVKDKEHLGLRLMIRLNFKFIFNLKTFSLNYP